MKKLHPKAKDVLLDPFYWDANNGISPFSRNKISHYFDDFKRWRIENPKQNPVGFLPDLGSDFLFNRNSIDPKDIKNFYKFHFDFQMKSFSENPELIALRDSLYKGELNNDEVKLQQESTARYMGFTALMEQDDEIISIGFGQFALEGTMHPDLKLLTEKALMRQLYPFILEAYPDSEFQAIRKKQLEIMLNDLKKVE